MADPAEGLDAAPRGADDAPGRRARARLDRFTASVARRLNLAGLLLVGAALCAADFLAVGNPLWTAVLTGLQAMLALPWAWTVVQMDRIEARVLDSKRLGRFRRVAGHAINFALLGTVLLVKALVVRAAFEHGFGEGLAEAYRGYVVVVFLLLGVGLLGRGSRLARFLGTLADHPARLMAISFFVVALLGAFLLSMPISVRTGWKSVNFVDALFTSTSAVCVTGLAVNDIGATYSAFGQAVIFTLIQAGGLGIMVLSASVAILAGRRLRVRSTAALTEMIDAESFAVLRRTIRHIFLFTIAIEVVGAIVLYLAFGGHPEIAHGPESMHAAAGAGSRVWASVFLSVSAFCNAGFTLSHGNLVAFGDSPSVFGPIAVLVVLGGIGFPVLNELWERVRRRVPGPPRRLSLHARLVLVTSAGLILAGTILFLVVESWRESFEPLTATDRLLNAVFQSVTTRTAGFNTVDFSVMSPAMLLAVALFMFVGASPGSCGGGIKTTTFAVLVAALRAEMRGRLLPRIFDRAVPEGTVRKAASVALGGCAVIGAAWFTLMLLEVHSPLALLFETVSAFATCGLSTGITPDMTDLGKLVVAALMFVGRIGPVTLALAVVMRPRVEYVGVPQEKVLIG